MGITSIKCCFPQHISHCLFCQWGGLTVSSRLTLGISVMERVAVRQSAHNSELNQRDKAHNRTADRRKVIRRLCLF